MSAISRAEDEVITYPKFFYIFVKFYLLGIIINRKGFSESIISADV